MFRISHAAAVFAQLDDLPDDKFPILDKALRNLTQRHFIEPSDRQGRADLYSIESVVVMRLAQKAEAFGIARHLLGDFIRFLQSAPMLPTRYLKGDGVHIALTTVQEAIERAREGEDFKLGLTMGGERVSPRAWWEGQAGHSDASLQIDAGRLIRDVLAKLV